MNLVLEKGIVQITVEPLGEGQLRVLPFHRVGESQLRPLLDQDRLLGRQVHFNNAAVVAGNAQLFARVDVSVNLPHLLVVGFLLRPLFVVFHLADHAPHR